MIKKKVIGIIVLVTIIFNSLSIDNIKGAEQIIATDQATFEKYLESIPTPVRTYNGLYRANFKTYEKYNEIVYGSPQDVPNNDFKEPPEYDTETGEREYRYLGYMVDSITKVRNNRFPVDVEPTTSPFNWHYLEVKNTGLWNIIDEDVANYVYTHDVYNLDYDIDLGDGFTPKYIDDHGVAKDSTPNNDMGAYARLQTQPTWFSDATIYIKRYSSGKTWYATFKTPGFGVGTYISKSINATSDHSTKDYNENTNTLEVSIPYEESQISVDIDVSATIKLEKAAKKEHIERFSVLIQDDEQVVSKQNINNHSISLNLKKSNFKSGKEITVPVEIKYNTIYGKDDAQSEYVNVKIIVHVEEKPTEESVIPIDPPPPINEPRIELTSTVNPMSAKFSNADVSVTLNVTSELFNVNQSEVSKMELDVNGIKHTQNGVTTIFKQFFFNIDKEDIGDKATYTKTWNITAKAYLKDGTTLTTSEEKETVVYKNNAMPTVTIYSEDKVRVGENVKLWASASSPIGAKIMGYYWGFGSGAVGNILPSENYGTIYYTTEGKKNVNVWVQDEYFNDAYAEKQIEVIPPLHYANIIYDGALKENRVITVKSDPDCPELYPVDDSTRQWTFKPSMQVVTGGLSKQKEFKFTPKSTGSVTVDLYEENVAGYSDTATENLQIVADMPPISNFSVISPVYRNPENYNRSTIVLFNKSYSPDYDELGQIKVRYKYDSNNDGSFSNETWVDAYEGDNKYDIEFEVGSIGKYLVELFVEEKFDIVTGFNSKNDFLSSVSYQIVTVDNFAPQADLNIVNKIPIKLDFNLADYEGMTEQGLQSYIENSLKVELSAGGYNLESYTINVNPIKDVLLTIQQQASGYTTAQYETIKQSLLNDPNHISTNEKYAIIKENDRYKRDGDDKEYYVDYSRTNVVSGDKVKFYNQLRYKRVRKYSSGSYSTKWYLRYPFFTAPKLNTLYLFYTRSKPASYYPDYEKRVITFESTLNRYARDLYDTILMSLDNSELINDESYQSQLLNTCNTNKITLIRVTKTTSPTNNSTGGFTVNDLNISEKLLQLLDEKYKEDDSLDDIKTFVINEPIQFDSFYMDYENDQLYDKKITVESIDPNYYDNPNYTNFTIDVDNIHIPYVGLYSLNYSVQDNPKDDNSFSGYRKWSDEAKQKVLVHRKPIADYVVTEAYKNGIDLQDNSYDLDHMYSDANKGIVEREYRYRKKNETWIAGMPTSLVAYVDYEFSMRVKDLEDSWSDWKTETIKPINQTVPLTLLTASLKATDSKFSTSSIPSSEWLTVYNLSSIYHQDHYIKIDVLSGTTVKATKTVNYSVATGTKVDSTIYWNDVNIQIPSTLADGNYKLRVTAIDKADTSNTDYKEFDITVSTPVNLVGTMDNELKYNVGEVIEANTSKYVNNVTITLFKGTAYQRIKTLSYNKTVGDKKYWLLNYKEDRSSIPDINYTAQFRATTPNGNQETETKSYKYKGNTPHNLKGYINNSVSNATIYLLENTTLSADTSIYVKSVIVNILGSNVNLTYKQTIGSIKKWEKVIVINSLVGETTDDAIFTSTTIYNIVGTYANGGKVDVDFSTKMALEITGFVNPNPALAGEKVSFTCNTKGMGETVVVDLDSIENGRTISLTPDSAITNDQNIFRGSYIIPLNTDDGLYQVTATVYKNTAFGIKSEKVDMQLEISGNMLQLIKPQIIDSN